MRYCPACAAFGRSGPDPRLRAHRDGATCRGRLAFVPKAMELGGGGRHDAIRIVRLDRGAGADAAGDRARSTARRSRAGSRNARAGCGGGRSRRRRDAADRDPGAAHEHCRDRRLGISRERPGGCVVLRTPCHDRRAGLGGGGRTVAAGLRLRARAGVRRAGGTGRGDPRGSGAGGRREACGRGRGRRAPRRQSRPRGDRARPDAGAQRRTGQDRGALPGRAHRRRLRHHHPRRDRAAGRRAPAHERGARGRNRVPAPGMPRRSSGRLREARPT